MTSKLLFKTMILILSVLFFAAGQSLACPGIPPVADLTADPCWTVVDVNVILDGSDSSDSDGNIVKYEWDFDYQGGWSYDYYETSGDACDGAFDGNTPHSYSSPGAYTVKLRVTDDDGKTDTDTFVVYVNTTWYVDEDAGADGNGLSWATAFDDLQEALDTVIYGDDIWVAEGTYKPNDIDLDNGLIHHWKFDEGANSTAYDSVGSFDFTLYGDANWVSGHIGDYALTLDGDDDYGKCLVGGIFGKKNFSITAWFKTGSASKGTIICQPPGSPWWFEYLILDVLDDGRVRFEYTTHDCQKIISTSSYNDDEWHLAVAVRDGFRTGKVYVDTSLEAEDTDNSGSLDGIDICNSYLYIGSYFDNSPVAELDGQIDDLRIYDDLVLSQDKINKLYGDERLCSFRLVEGVEIYGGFAGTETDINDRDWTIYPTILSGDIGTADDINDNSYNVVIGADDALLDGFTIKCGNANDVNEYSCGGGMYNDDTSPDVNNCAFVYNLAKADGGAIYNNGSSADPTIQNCLFVDNDANCGGAVYDNNSSPTIVSCTLSGNNASDDGGALYNYGTSSTPMITNCIIWDNNAVGDGNEVFNSTEPNADPNFSYCDIKGCGGSGGGWDPNFGTDGGGNIDSDPCFVDADNPAGSDGIFATWDDGLRLTLDSNCIDAADGNAAPSEDMLGLWRIDVNDVSNTGTGDPNYVDIGAFESRNDFGNKVSAGNHHSLVRMDNGTVWGCGTKQLYRLGMPGNGNQYVLTQIPDGNMNTESGYLENITAISASYTHSLALDTSGYVWAWGMSTRGQLGNGASGYPVSYLYSPDRVENIENIIDIDASPYSGNSSIALDSSGNVWAWGRNSNGQLGNDDTSIEQTTPVKVHDGEQTPGSSDYLEDIIDVDFGCYYALAADSDGYAYAWGNGYYGQLGNGSDHNDVYTPIKVHDGDMNTTSGYLEDIVAVSACPSDSSYALDDSNCIWAWGNNTYGQLGNDSTTHVDEPVHVLDGDMNTVSGYLEDIVAICSGKEHILALDTSGNVWAWGNNNVGELGDGTTYQRHTPVKVKDSSGTGYLSNIVEIDAGYSYSMAVDSNGIVWVWGSNYSGKLGIGNTDITYFTNLPIKMWW